MNVPSPNRHLRERGTSLPDPQTGNGKGKRSHTIDLYRLREFTVKNNRIISHTESLQPRYGRSSNSINSSASRYVWFSDGQVGYPKIWVIRPPGYRYLRGTARNMSFYKYPTRWILAHKSSHLQSMCTCTVLDCGNFALTVKKLFFDLTWRAFTEV